jgi:hypothetical protein
MALSPNGTFPHSVPPLLPTLQSLLLPSHRYYLRSYRYYLRSYRYSTHSFFRSTHSFFRSTCSKPIPILPLPFHPLLLTLLLPFLLTCYFRSSLLLLPFLPSLPVPSYIPTVPLIHIFALILSFTLLLF